jgi:hypothetical protein
VKAMSRAESRLPVYSFVEQASSYDLRAVSISDILVRVVVISS